MEEEEEEEGDDDDEDDGADDYEDDGEEEEETLAVGLLFRSDSSTPILPTFVKKSETQTGRERERESFTTFGITGSGSHMGASSSSSELAGLAIWHTCHILLEIFCTTAEYQGRDDRRKRQLGRKELATPKIGRHAAAAVVSRRHRIIEMGRKESCLMLLLQMVESWMQQPHMGKVLATVAASIIHSSSGMSKWGIADLTLGLYKLSGRHALEGAADTIPGFPVMYRSELDNMLQWLQWAEAAYKRDKPSLASAVQIPETDVVKMVTASAVLKPAFFIAVHHRHKCVVLGIHGTYARNDILTDLTPHCESFKGGSAHSENFSSSTMAVTQ